ncbi:putative bacteriophage protein [Nocardia nova SH22a]|uniref:Putative bacteriophage protein n=1 Tax=Nocardia nova SH22a TaxID=1415166 RepID=W5TUM7_9NOCA|nr:hypothetical protein [Nocardia nova]AHH20861.1 putative bacteriophage protein [Nocardia nova SH22a]
MTTATLPSHADIAAGAQLRRDALNAMRRARPLPRLWTNKKDGSPGLELMGSAEDSITGAFPFKRNQFGTSGTLTIRLDHYLAKWLISIPDDPEAKKNVVITVDHYGGKVRWSGLLKYFKAVKKNGLWYLEVTFIDDLQYLQFLLGAPNPVLPISIFQFPRVLPIFGPAKWAISMMILLNLIRIEGNLWNLPDDPFAVGSWNGLFDWSSWQVLIKAKAIDLDDSSVWTLLATRMNRMDQVIQNALDDAQLTMRYRRILTVDGEVSDVPGVPEVANGALVLEVVDTSGYYSPDGVATGGGIVGGFARTVQGFASGFVEDVQTIAGDVESWPASYYDDGYIGPGDPTRTWIVLRDSKYSNIETSEWTWGPATAARAIAGGDNPLIDNLAHLTIESIGALIGYFCLGGFSGLGSIVADVVMPFLVGTIFAWVEWQNHTRAHNLGWAHLWEVLAQGAENNAWSLGTIVALRGAFLSTASQASHVMEMGSGGRFLPGLMFMPGDRVGSTFEQATATIRVDLCEEIDLSWDYESDRPHEYRAKIGLAQATMSLAERQARQISFALSVIANIGVHLLS